MKNPFQRFSAYINQQPSRNTTIGLIGLIIVLTIFVSEFIPLVLNEGKFVITQVTNIVEAASLLAADLAYPKKFEPVARFTVNMNWDTNTIKLDGSTSKTYDDKVARYVWRIDDGSSDAESATIEHTFAHPGYYLIRLSVVDSNDQVDSATCQLFIPPAEIEPIESRRTETGVNAQTERTTIESEWAPVGTFYNYTKMDTTSNAALKSRFVESGCGFSNQNFNTVGQAIDKEKVNTIISSATALAVNLVFVVLFIVIVRKFFYSAKSALMAMEKESSKT
jgi:hypothetical protein